MHRRRPPALLRVLALSALALLPAHLALAAPGFRTSGSFCEAVWTDGEDRLVTACNSITVVHTRGVEDGQYGGPRRTAQLDGLGRGAGVVLAAVTEAGTAARLEAGRWQEGSPPGADKLVAAAVDASGRTWFAGARALHLWQGGDRWTASPYPRPALQVVRLARGDGGLYLVTRGAEVLHADGRGALTSIARLADQSDADVKGLWFAQGSRRLYLLRGMVGVTVLERASGRVTTTRLPTWGTALAGVEAAGGAGESALIADARGLLALRGGKLYVVDEGRYAFVRQLAWSARDGTLYVAAQDGIHAVPLDLSALAAGRLKRFESPQARARRQSGVTYPGRLNYLSLALAMGPSGSWVPGVESGTAFTLDLELGLRMPFALLRGRPIALWPTIGYSYDSHGVAGGHRFAGGLGLSVFTPGLAFGATAASRFLAGTVGETHALGVRSGLRLEVFLGIFSIDVAHEALYVERTIHDLRVTFGVDFVSWYRIFTLFSFLKSPSWAGALGLAGLLGI